MKRYMLVSFLAVVFAAATLAQDISSGGWNVTPSVVYLRQFPGEPVPTSNYYGSGSIRYSASGFSFRTRLSNVESSITYTLSSGVTWYSTRDKQGINTIQPMAVDAVNAIGSDLKGTDFTVFPMSAGVQWLFPRSEEQSFIAYVGAEASFNFIDGRVDLGQQAKLGYSVLAGFSVKQFEFGVQYSAFSDLKNLGASLGIRFGAFSLE